MDTLQTEITTDTVAAPTFVIASRWRRLGAYLIDYFILLPITVFSGLIAGVIIGLVQGQSSPEQQMKMFIVSSICGAIFNCIYFGLFTVFIQATPGKLLLKIKVTDHQGAKLPASRVLVRELLRLLSPLMFGHIWLFFNKRKKNSWDYAARSLVVHR